MGCTTILWAGQCLVCGDCFEKETEENKPPLHDEDGKSFGAFCPSCKDRGQKLLGVIHFHQRREDFVENTEIAPHFRARFR
mgnify:CR=1 FL=1